MSRSQKVMDLVRSELQKNPKIETKKLFEEAKKADDSISGLSLRQFNARYPLQVKRQMSAKKDGGRAETKRPSRKPAKQSSDADRQAIREGLLRFATDVAQAEGKANLIDVLTSVDEYVEDVAEDLDL